MARRRKAVARGRKAHRAGRASTGSSNVAGQDQAKEFKMSTLDPGQTPSPAKRTPRKAAARGKWSEEKLLTSDESELITRDLVKLLARPEAWYVLEENEKREILALLPADTHPDADLTADDPDARIPPLPDSFVRYSNNWRAGIRQFQVDLENGRYDPEWLREAESARQQRENGDFDAFKEREFEQFWGQKQKMDMRSAAGECANIRLGTLLQAGVILPGDVWRYTFVFGKGAERIVIDKEARVHEIDGSKMTFVIPTGTRTFLTGETEKPDQATEKEEHETGSSEAKPVQSDSTSPQETESAPIKTKEDTPVSDREGDAPETRDMPPSTPCTAPKTESQNNPSPVQVVIMGSGSKLGTPTDGLKRASAPQQPSAEPPAKRKRGRPRKIKPVESEPEPEKEEPIEDETGVREPSEGNIDPVRPESMSPVKGPSDTQPQPETNNTNEDLMDTTTDEAEQNAPASSPLSAPPEDLTPPASQPVAIDSGDAPTASEPNEIIVPNIKSPNMLVAKILEIDGRPKEGARTANAWKEIRCYRKNQDMGSLWDIRQVWYFKQQEKS